MTSGDEILVRALAHADAIRLPIRDWGERSHAPANRTEGAKLLATHGVPVRVGGDAADRKSGERQLTELADAGLLTVHRYGRVRFPHVKLTYPGEARARAIAGLPGRDVGRLFLAAVVEGSAKYLLTISGRWCPEVDLNGGLGWGATATTEEREQLAAIELDFLPAASAGWCRAHSSLRGHVAYLATEAGLAELANPSAVPDPGPLPAADPAGADLYRSTQDAALRELAVTPPKRAGEIGDCPLIESVTVMRDQAGAGGASG